MTRFMTRAAITLAVLLSATSIAAEPVRVSVLYFDINSNEKSLDVLSKGFAELMITDLVQSTDFAVVERARLEQVLAELKLGETRFADPKTAARIGKLVGAQFMVIGSIVERVSFTKGAGVNPHMMNVRVLDIEKSQYVGEAGIKIMIDPDDVFAAEEKAVAEVAKLLVKAGAGKQANDPPKKAHKLPMETAAKYARALDAKDKKDKTQAVKLLNEVVKDQPDFKLAQLDLLNLTK